MPDLPPPDPYSVLLHATCVVVGGWGVLLVGPSGSGKSDLALRLIDESERDNAPSPLVADDQVLVRRVDDALVASPPPGLAGLMEVRGLGIVQVAYVPQARLCLVAELKPAAEIERLPEPETQTTRILGIEIPKVEIDPRPASATARLRKAVEFVALAPANRQNRFFAPRVGPNPATVASGSARVAARGCEGEWA